ncbi:hypothetical protein SAMN05216223_11232 [Actinacidiphila yanglinensis]|uniref:Uncharacterized protein n=1 Tax=Actinacidiphila yanglinensis TaxID=310779 RepID=A0A1H6D4Z9_9ACTN|nr:hypothetical protein SAMN05216223_11232 [Actinacidiphila yanglinensis]
MLKKITLTTSAVAFGALLAVNLPDLRRYLRIRAM